MPSHYRPSSANGGALETPSQVGEYVFPERRNVSPVRQAAFEAEVAGPPTTPSHTSVLNASREPIKLAPRGSHASGATASRPKPVGASQAIGTVGGSLAVVLGIFFLFAWLMRKHLPAGTKPLPKEAVEMLGRAPLLGRQQLSLLKVGNKLVLLAVSPLGGAEAITEITDPAEVDRLIGLCQSARPGSVATSFRQALVDLSGERANGFLGSEERPRRRAAT